MGKILTISIAAYNMEKYLTETLNSVALPEIIDEIEVFVIDDGGKDRSLEIAKQFQKKYPDSIFPVHKENGGYGSTVNYSIAHASGKYFKLLDGDDWFERDGLIRLVKTLKETDADVVMTSMKIGSDKEHMKSMPLFDVPAGKVIRTEEYTSLRHLGMWSITYKTEVLRASGMVLPEHMLYTDQLFSTIPFAAAETMTFCDYYVYCYRIGRDGQSVSPEARIKHLDETLSHCTRMTEFCAGQKNGKNYGYIKNRVTAYYCAALRALLLLPVNRESLRRFKNYEQSIRSISADVWQEVVTVGGMGKLIRILRLTHYTAYWLLKPVPKNKINWV